VSYQLPECVFDCTHILDSKPSLLQVAAFFGSVKCFEFLIAAGADPHTPAQRGLTLADFAVAGGNSELISRVLDLDVDVRGVFATAAKFHRSVAFDFLVENCDVIYESPYSVGFVAAAESNNLSLLLKCIDQGVDVNMRDPVNKTALSASAQFGHTDVLKFLLAHPEIDANVVSGYHDLTILDWAISGDDPAAVKTVLGCQKCARPGSKDWIKVAIARGNVEVLEMLLQTQALRIDEEFEDRLRPLHVAIADESVPAVRLFLAWPGVDVNAIDAEGRTPLHYAAVGGCVAIARLLVGQPGIDLSVEDGEHGTPLNLAIEWGQCEIEALLRENGAVASRHHHNQVEVPQPVPVPKPKQKPMPDSP
jgi:ankyrin repeat protein